MNSLPPGAPGSAAHGLALDALGSGFSTAFLVCAAAAAVAAALTSFGMTGTHTRRSAGDSAGDEVSAPLPSGRDGTPEPAPM
ncbi:hypothetical protein [Streptomyces sp. enrichment culture]|uniref:hypothetical protein n=1 Tax=Streptomyces sp. enrichment culture TaxID=1795815 RepID=UPI003F55A654